MATAAGPATPQRPLPGAFAITPAAAQQPPPGSTIFAANAATLRQNPQPPPTDTPARSQNAEAKTPAQSAAESINKTLSAEEQFPPLEDYVTQGSSGEYEQSTNPALLPFQKMKLHDVPARLLEQINSTQMATQMGVFAPLGHAWIALDNCLYLWDYTATNPEIIGFEENTQTITTVKLVPPKPGVFVEDIKHMIVVCTATDMLLLGAAKATTATGAPTVNLYNTRMSIPVRGLAVHIIEASKKTGRIFFAGRSSDDIYEFQYQQDEGWFRGKCQRLCHTKGVGSQVGSYATVIGGFLGPKPTIKSFQQMAIDDSRNMLYTLSTTSEIRIWLIQKPDKLAQSLMRPLATLLQGAGHFSNRSELLSGADVSLKAICPITAAETRAVSLMATTNTGCRLYLSVLRGYGHPADAHNPPSSMQILHIRYPPKDPNAQAAPALSSSTALAPYNNQSVGQIDTSSTYLRPMNMAYRYAPGYWLAFLQDANGGPDKVYCVATDLARLKHEKETGATRRYVESGQWIELPARMSEVVEMTEPFGATREPLGFENELAVQFDQSSTEIAIVTSSGIQTIRRKRLVDIFAALMKYGSTDEEGIEGDIKRFVRTYGRSETAATALAVACGQGVDITDSRIASVADQEVIEKARKVFIEYGGSPEYNANAVVTENTSPTDNVNPSPRYHGIALYVSRLVRSVWRNRVIKPNEKPGIADPRFVPGVNLEKLKTLSRSLNELKQLLDKNRSFIEGLSGPQALGRVKSRQEEVALQGEHKAMNSMLKLIDAISEGISFVVVLFDERVDEILALLHEENRRSALELRFEALFVSNPGRLLGRELVKAIVNRNIANGSNVDTVAEALRRRCGSFCSADDVVIFKAQEQVTRAASAGAETENGRQLLNESQRLFQRCAASLSQENLEAAVKDYIAASFFAGAIQLCLVVADERDKAKRAWAYLRDGMQQDDTRADAFQARQDCYRLIFTTIQQLDAATSNAPESQDGKRTIAAKRRSEAYDIVDQSDDLVFLTCLYDWYIVDLQQPDRLITITNRYVVQYLRKRSEHSKSHNDLLWRYYIHYSDFLQAASVQLELAKSHFEGINLDKRIEYLSLARNNASTRQSIITDSRQNKQRILREVSDLIEIAEVQQELLERLRAETRIQDADHKARLVDELNWNILPIQDLFNKYADAARYHDICLLLYKAADHRSPADIKSSWEQLIKDTSAEAIAIYGHQQRPWEAVGEEVRRLGRRLGMHPSIFPISVLLPLLEAYALEPRVDHPPDPWSIDIMLDLDVPCETLLPVLEHMYFSNLPPFTGNRKRKVAEKMVYVVQKWFEASERSGERVLFGSEENLSLVRDCLAGLGRDRGLGSGLRDAAGEILGRIGEALR